MVFFHSNVQFLSILSSFYQVYPTSAPYYQVIWCTHHTLHSVCNTVTNLGVFLVVHCSLPSSLLLSAYQVILYIPQNCTWKKKENETNENWIQMKLSDDQSIWYLVPLIHWQNSILSTQAWENTVTTCNDFGFPAMQWKTQGTGYMGSEPTLW